MSTVQLGRGAWSCAHARSAHRGAEPNAEPFPSSSGCAGSQGCSLRGTAAGLLPADVCVYPPLLRFVIPCISLIRQRPSWSPRANAALAPHRPERPGTGGINASRLTPPRARGALVSCTPHLQCEAARRGEEGRGVWGAGGLQGPACCRVARSCLLPCSKISDADLHPSRPPPGHQPRQLQEGSRAVRLQRCHQLSSPCFGVSGGWQQGLASPRAGERGHQAPARAACLGQQR